ncbi:MAG: hypothetical protein GTO18_03985 [Anaerolineales bacterium]|nr:hypothetical protein [Anaerolineales bacterium]
MSSRKVPDNDALDVFIGRCLKNWVSLYPLPSARQGKAHLLREASLISMESSSWTAFWLPLIRIMLWVFDVLYNYFAGEPSINSTVTEDAILKNSGLSLTSTRQAMLHSYPISVGVSCLIS